MFALISTVFVASLIGSLHCAGMCGAFVALAVGGTEPGPSRKALNAAYNLGRLTTYLALGLAVGGLGALVDLGGAMVGVQRVAALAAGTLMVAIGLVAVLRHAGVQIAAARIPGFLKRLAQGGHRLAARLQPLPRAAAIGLLTTLLPCGWLYAFAVTAAGTGSPWLGALTMGAFWLGTLPVMVTLGIGLRAATGSLGKRLPMLTSLAVVAVGLYVVFGRLQLPPMSLQAAPAATETTSAAIGQAPGPGAALSPADLIDTVPNADTPLPCCAPVDHD